MHSDISAGFSIQTKVEWSNGTATIELYGKEVKGTVVGLRPHDEAFKLSITYEDPISGPTEMVIFQVPGKIPATYRRAIVGYDLLPDGTRVVSHVFGFEDVSCTMLE